ncbi:hypothetical protein Tco_0240158, partial [Tanacetum coccineum]
MVGGSSLMEAILLVMINPRLNVSTVTSWDTLPESAEVLGVRTTGQGMELALIRVTWLRSKFRLIWHSWHSQILSEFKTATYKRGLATLEEQIVTYKKNEVLFSEEVVVLKREVGCKLYEIGVLRSELEKVKQEKDGIEFKITKFDKSAKDLDEMLESQ